MSSSDILDQLDLFEWFRDVVDTSIHEMIVDKLSSSAELNDFHYNSVSYYPIYYRCKETGKKMLKCLNLKVKPLCEDEFVVITIDEIEKTGASWEEFVDFLKFSDATLVDYKSLL